MTRLSWFKSFARALVERSNRSDWAPFGTEYWADFERSLAGTDCTAEQADRAASAVCDLPGIFPTEYRPKILESVRSIVASDRNPTDASLGTRERAAAASKDCPECGGTGQSVRYSHGDGRLKVPAGLSVGGWCGSCPHGRHLASRNGGKTWDELGFPHPARHCYRPSQWDEANNRPFPAPDPGDFLRRIRGLNAIRGPRARLGSSATSRAIVHQSEPADAAGATPGRPPVGPDPILDREPQPF